MASFLRLACHGTGQQADMGCLWDVAVAVALGSSRRTEEQKLGICPHSKKTQNFIPKRSIPGGWLDGRAETQPVLILRIRIGFLIHRKIDFLSIFCYEQNDTKRSSIYDIQKSFCLLPLFILFLLNYFIRVLCHRGKILLHHIYHHISNLPASLILQAHSSQLS